MTLPVFKLLPTATYVNAPFCFGHTFKQGDVPSGSSVTAPFPDFQCIAKNTWPDGSLRFAILSGRASVSGTTPLLSQLSVGSATSGTPILASSLTTTASFSCGSFGSASWTALELATPFFTWISGPKMSSFIYRKQVGSDAHLVAWMELRVWSGGEVEVLPWIENCYFRVAAPTNKSATYTFTLGGTQRFSAAIDLKHHQRTPLVSGTALSYWVGTDPGVTPFHDQAYFMASEMVPSYSSTVNASSLSTLPTTFTPLQRGGIVYDGSYGTDAMTNPGYQAPIGLLPEYDVAYLVGNTQPELLYAAVVRNGYSAGRYGIHYRDEITQIPPAFSSYPTLVIADDDTIKNTGASTTGTRTPAATGGNPPIWDPAHHPSVGFMAYLITGRFYFKEETQFAATANHFAVTDWVRGGGLGNDYNPFPGYTGASGIWTSATQTRTGAWCFRTLTQALAITPDSGDALKSELVASIEDNCRYFHTMYVAQANHPYGFIQSGESYTDVTGSTDHQMVPPWMHDFGTASWGMALCLGLPISTTAATKMAAFFQWKAQSVVSRLGPSGSAFPFEDGAPYRYATSPSLAPVYSTGAGPWYSNLSQVYAATYVAGQPSDSTGTNLLGYNGSNPERSMWGNLHAALAYAERHQVPGAAAAGSRVRGAANYSTMTTNFNISPVWSVKSSGATSQVGGVVVAPTGPTIAVGTGLIGGRIAVKPYDGRGIVPFLVAKGFSQPSFLGNDISGAVATDEFTFSIDSVPAGLSLTVYPDSSAVASAADGFYTGTQTVYRNGIADTGTYTVGFGTVDTTDPVMSGNITVTGTTSSGFTVNYPAATDNVAISFYELSLNGGLSYNNVGNVTSVQKTGLSGGTLFSLRVRAVDTSGRRSNVLSYDTSTSQVILFATTVTFAVVDSTGVPVNATGLDYAFYDQPRISAGIAPVKYGSNLSIQNGVATISIAGVTSLFPGGRGRIEWGDAAGTKRGGGPVTVI